MLASSGGAAVAVFVLIYIAILVVELAGAWKVFTKANQPGWGVIIPFYNAYLVLKIVGRPGWWLLLFFIPIVNIVIWAIVSIDLARSFRKDTGFGIGLWILGFIFIPILGFGDSTYAGPVVAS